MGNLVISRSGARQLSGKRDGASLRSTAVRETGQFDVRYTFPMITLELTPVDVDALLKCIHPYVDKSKRKAYRWQLLSSGEKARLNLIFQRLNAEAAAKKAS